MCADAYAHAMRRLGGVAGPLFGEGTWRLLEGQLTLRWCGMEERIAVAGGQDFWVRVPAITMRGLAQSPDLGDFELEVFADVERLHLGALAFPCAVVREAPAFSLPVGSGDGDLLIAGLTHDEGQVASAGYADQYERVEERLWSSSVQAARSLGWLGVSPLQLEELLKAHLRGCVMGTIGEGNARAAGVAEDEECICECERSE